MHVPIAGGVLKAVERARRLGCTTMQIFSRSPRGGRATARSWQEVERFDAERRRAGIEPLVVHSPYIINLASPEGGLWRSSLRLYEEEVARSAALRARYLVTHVGSHRGSGEAMGITRVREALARTLERSQADVMVLLENTAGAGQGLGDRFEQLAAIREGLPAKERVGICLDTAHLFAAGYPIHTTEGLEEVITTFDRLVGLEHLKVVHLNDSKVPFRSRVDRHWHIGEGQMGLAAFRRFVNHPRLRHLPLILETPKKTEAEDERNVATVRKLSRS